MNDLQTALVHENEDVRKFAADILGLTGTELAVHDLCKAVLEDDVDNIVCTVIEELRKIGSAKTLPALYRFFNETKSMKADCVEAIGLIGDPESASFLHERLDGNDPIVMYAVIDALGNLKQDSSLPVLMDYLPKAPDVFKEQICLAALKIGQHKKMNVINSDNLEFVASVVRLCKNQQNGITDLVAYQLSLNPDAEVLNIFFENLEILPTELVAALINAAKTEKKLLNKLSQLTRHQDNWVSYTAVEALSSFNKQEVKNTILSMLDENRGLPAIAAVKTVANLHLEEAIPILQDLKNSANEDILLVGSRRSIA